MLTVVAVLLLPTVFGISVFRLCKIPLTLWKHEAKFNQRFFVIAVLAFTFAYILLLSYTAIIIYTFTRAIISPPRTIYNVFSIAKVTAGYPLIYLRFEWILYYSLKPCSHARSAYI